MVLKESEKYNSERKNGDHMRFLMPSLSWSHCSDVAEALIHHLNFLSLTHAEA